MARLESLTPALKDRRYPEFKYELFPERVRDYKINMGYGAQAQAELAFVPPTFLTCFRAGEFHIFTELEIELAQLLHAGHRYDFFRPLRPTETLTGHSTVQDVKTKNTKSGTMVFLSLRTEFRDSVGERVSETTTLVVVRSLEVRMPVAPFTTIQVPADLPLVSTALPALREYARLSGDNNPIHYDATEAQRMGLPAPIAHGMFGLDHLFRVAYEGVASQALHAESLEARFVAMIPAESSFGVRSSIVKISDAKVEVNLEAVLNTETVATTAKAIFSDSKFRG